MFGWYDWVIGGVLILLALVIIAVVLLQEGLHKDHLEIFNDKGKAKAVDAVLAKATKWIAIIFMLLVVVCFVLSIVLK